VGRVMPVYRFYRIEKNGHVTGPPPIRVLPDDPDAVHEATKLLNRKDIEIWQGSRLVAYVTAKEKKSQRERLG
jgi:hypothetical protein